MRYLLIDNSNSRTKFVLADESSLSGEIVRIDTAELSLEKLKVVTQGMNFDAVLVCSVVPEKAKVLETFFSERPFHLLNHDSPHGITIEFPNPEQIGADRIANAIGVEALFSTPAVVIDFGTAVTFDVVGSGARYLGGAIAPGLGSMNDYLHNKTALLPNISICEPDCAIGQSTVGAMQSGAVYGYRGLVKGILEKIIEEMGEQPLVVSTGGDGKVIADGVTEIDYFSSTITLEGLRSAALRVF